MAEKAAHKVLSKERQGEIALLLLKRQLRKTQISAPADLKRDLGNIAKEIGIPMLELRDFLLPLYHAEIDLQTGFCELTIS
ncbi:hypothetical protein A3A09_02380 [Candidatus Nomurabacteria bacterium RIFCSPLOWO2_01_FULL_42_20]|uniref:Uncharacterized protein n=1 Tax=Candidatus Nomurabacteria bacterium RIFCSPHIGHO2_01_FULL_42_16 TaxID=1801743 RepID=A0A1F6VK14_9BACT|nr:MAG: hypothetical protein A2824_01395 [Candidatus Nomurabacteria bacterium RIFCSPHIGHO2_01_FULL_42_16]OGI92126.1 MAG: hypothetical protein A3A09_02380 [Candidatus Nomurabacteria bacterium RIFCSPLOWO2_01_FULL_42_20]